MLVAGWGVTNGWGGIPRLLYLPAGFVKYCLEARRTPYELMKHLGEEMVQANSTLDVADIELLKEWCGVACQHNTAGKSLLFLDMELVIPGDLVIGKWMQDRLNRTMGVEA